MQTGFALAAFVTLILNLVLPEEIEDEEIPELTADHTDDVGDSEEWDRIRNGPSKEGVVSEGTPAETQKI